MTSPEAPAPPGQVAPDDEVSRRRRDELARLLGALPPEEHEPVIAAFRTLAAAAGELPQPGAALGWAGP